MTRQELIEDFQHFLDTHKEEVKAHLSEPQLEWFDDDGWDDEKRTKTLEIFSGSGTCINSVLEDLP